MEHRNFLVKHKVHTLKLFKANIIREIARTPNIYDANKYTSTNEKFKQSPCPDWKTRPFPTYLLSESGKERKFDSLKTSQTAYNDSARNTAITEVYFRHPATPPRHHHPGVACHTRKQSAQSRYTR